MTISLRRIKALATTATVALASVSMTACAPSVDVGATASLNGTAIVTAKLATPASKGTKVGPVSIPDAPEITVKVGDKTINVPTTASIFNKVKSGAKVCVKGGIIVSLGSC